MLWGVKQEVLIGKEGVKKRTQKKRVYIEHNEEPDTHRDKTPHAISFIAHNSATKVVGDRSIPDSESGACEKD